MNQNTENLANIVRNLSNEELVALRYFIKYRSVGEILAIRELRSSGLKNPSKVLARLISLGLINQGTGCYTISRELLDAVKRGYVKL